MTYPPQDPGYSGGYPGGDQYGQSQPGPPPAGGYAPGQYGAPQYPTSQQPGQYQDPGAQYQQPAYDPTQAGYQHPYAPQYGPPPVQPSTGGGSTTAILIVVVVLLMAVGGAAGYFLLGGDKDEGTIEASDDQTSESAEEDTGEEGGGEDEETDDSGVSGTGLTVGSLDAFTPVPGPEWSFYYGPGVNEGLLNDSEAYFIQHTDSWISYFSVGVYSNAAAAYDPSDLHASARNAADYWLDGAFGSTTGFKQGEITYSNVEVDGRTGVLAEWRSSWDSTPATTDLYEDTALLVVDVDGVNGFIGVASTSETAVDLYPAAVEALLGTTFGSETA